ncbi:hypothetical protein LJC52_04950 [Bacteroidales bacterium OttesenSCG-928-A17]|nr:hypothetical protein [Bacteroidales bacterium OttesenSCG-928-A17]
MKKTIVFIICIFFCFLSAKADTVVPKDTLQANTFQLNKESLKELLQEGRYQYNQEEFPALSWWEELKAAIHRWFLEQGDIELSENQLGMFLIISSIIILLLIGILLYVFRPKLFYLDKKGKLYSLEEELQELNYPQLIRKAIKQQAFAEAIRWEYLQLLNELHAEKLISYDSNKTVNEYVYEIKDKGLRNRFRDLSSAFLYYRYGNGIADRKVYDSFRDESNQLLNTISQL